MNEREDANLLDGSAAALIDEAEARGAHAYNATEADYLASQLFRDQASPPGPAIPDCNITDLPRNVCRIYDEIVDNIAVYPDHILINGTFPVLRSRYFSTRLAGLEHFDGFCPRWIIPQTRMVASTDITHERVATQTLLIIDSAAEVKVGVGLNTWPPLVLGRSEVQIPAQVASYLGVQVGDPVSLYADLGDTIPDVGSPRAHLLGAVVAGMPNVAMNFDLEAIQYKGYAYPFEMFGLSGNYTGYNLTYTVAGTYDAPDGKFSQLYGNVALIDCGYFVEQIIDELYAEA